MTDAPTSILPGRGDESLLDRIAVNISNPFGSGGFAVNVRVEVAGLAELAAVPSPRARPLPEDTLIAIRPR
jgi:hypothetical protein